jgi:hypothetical protein
MNCIGQTVSVQIASATQRHPKHEPTDHIWYRPLELLLLQTSACNITAIYCVWQLRKGKVGYLCLDLADSQLTLVGTELLLYVFVDHELDIGLTVAIKSEKINCSKTAIT